MFQQSTTALSALSLPASTLAGSQKSVHRQTDNSAPAKEFDGRGDAFGTLIKT